MASDHPGMFMPEGYQGAIERKGLVLMKRLKEVHELRQRYQRLQAKQAVRDKEAQMGHAPPGTGPRTGVARLQEPMVRKSYERVIDA